MNRMSGENDLGALSESTKAAELPARRPWVKPVLERLSLNDALTAAVPTGSDGPTGGVS
jgi:hypothetical protein